MNYLIRRRKLGRGSCRGIVAASNTGLQAFRNDMRLPDKADMVFRWGCTSNVPNVKNIVNKAEAIHAVSDKAEFRRVLNEKELCPATWFREQEVMYPAVVRPRVHAQGRKLYVVNNAQELRAAVLKTGAGWYASELIKKVAEYRVFVVSGRAVWVANKIPANPKQVAWNVAQGGKFENVRWDDWPLKAVKTAIKAWELSGLDFGGVDVMVDDEGEVYVLEINAAPSQTSEYRQQCTAKAFDYIVKHGKDTLPLMQEKGGYKKFIHPGVCAEAIV